MGVSGSPERRRGSWPRLRIYEWFVAGAGRRHTGHIICFTWGRLLIEVAIGHEERGR